MKASSSPVEYHSPFEASTPDEGELLNMLRHLFVYPSYMSRLHKPLKDTNIFSDCGHPHCEDMFKVLQEHYEDNGEIPSADMFRTHAIHLAGEEELLMGEDVDKYVQQIRFWQDSRQPPDHRHIQHVFNDSRKQLLYEQLDGLALQPPEERDEAFRIITRQINVNPFDIIEPEDPFQNPMQYLKNLVRNPTFLAWLDEDMLDGGGVPGELIGDLAPPSAGKTSRALDIMMAQIEHRVPCDYIQTEQSMQDEPDMFVRMIARALNNTQFGKKLVQELLMCDKDGNLMPLTGQKAEQRKLLQELMEDIKKKTKGLFRYWDHTRSDRELSSLDAVFDPIRQIIAEEGEEAKPRYIIIDWWGLLQDRLVMSNPAMIKDQTLVRRQTRIWMQELRNIGRELGATIWLFHQFSGKVAGRSENYVGTGHDAAEDKSFPNLMDMVFVSSKLNKNGESFLETSKARRCRANRLRMRLNGDKATWEKLGNAWEDDMAQGEIEIEDAVVQEGEVPPAPQDDVDLNQAGRQPKRTLRRSR